MVPAFWTGRFMAIAGPSRYHRDVPGGFDWARFEKALYSELRRALAATGKAHRKERFYAVALYGVYRELDGLVSLPVLAAAPEADAPPQDGAGVHGARFSPPDWPLSEIPLARAPALRLERALTAEATRGSQAQWRQTEARYFGVLLRLTRRLRDDAPSLLKVTDDFVCFWHDEEGGVDLASKTIARPLVAKLFARQVEDAKQRRAVARKPAPDRAAYLVTRFDVHEGVTSEQAQTELLKLGKAAVGALVGALADPKTGWTAARVLGQIGVATPAVIAALRTTEAATGMYGWLISAHSGGNYEGLAWKCG